MTQEEQYRRGLEKLGLWKPNPCDDAESWLRLDGSRCCRRHRLDVGHDVIECPDLRTDPTFAWRVLEAYHKLPNGSVPQAWVGKYKTLADALYAAVCALGASE